jgi:hypothetical protein
LVEACDNEIFILHGVLDRNWKNIGWELGCCLNLNDS